MSQCWTRALDYHFDHGFTVFEHVQHRNGLRNYDVLRHTTGFPVLMNLWLHLVGFGCNETPR